jgi:hypothetical protein
MGLDDSALPYVGRTFDVQPFYGWGWQGNVEEPGPPAEFSMRLVRLWSTQGERRGGVGRVEHSGHSFDAFWVVFSTRHVGTFNFTDKPAHYNISISPNEPVDAPSGWPFMAGHPPHMSGYAYIVPHGGG